MNPSRPVFVHAGCAEIRCVICNINRRRDAAVAYSPTRIELCKDAVPQCLTSRASGDSARRHHQCAAPRAPAPTQRPQGAEGAPAGPGALAAEREPQPPLKRATAPRSTARAIRSCSRCAFARLALRAWAVASTTSRVSNSSSNIIYLGYAVGGVYRSLNNGTSFEPVFETYGSASIGAIAIPPDESEHRVRRDRRSEQPPDGVVRTTASTRRPDGGKTFKNIGLKETQDDRPHRHRSAQSRSRVRRCGRTPVRPERGTWRLQDDGRRRDVEQDQVRR